MMRGLHVLPQIRLLLLNIYYIDSRVHVGKTVNSGNCLCKPVQKIVVATKIIVLIYKKSKKKHRVMIKMNVYD